MLSSRVDFLHILNESEMSTWRVHILTYSIKIGGKLELLLHILWDGVLQVVIRQVESLRAQQDKQIVKHLPPTGVLLQLWCCCSFGAVAVVLWLLLWCCCSCDAVAVVVQLQLWCCCSCGAVAVVVLLLLWCGCSCGVVAVVMLLQLWCCCSFGAVSVVVLLQLCCFAVAVMLQL